MPNDAGWETYSKLVLQQLETLTKGILFKIIVVFLWN
jgi:hypothetical protein